MEREDRQRISAKVRAQPGPSLQMVQGKQPSVPAVPLVDTEREDRQRISAKDPVSPDDMEQPGGTGQ